MAIKLTPAQKRVLNQMRAEDLRLQFDRLTWVWRLRLRSDWVRSDAVDRRVVKALIRSGALRKLGETAYEVAR